MYLKINVNVILFNYGKKLYGKKVWIINVWFIFFLNILYLNFFYGKVGENNRFIMYEVVIIIERCYCECYLFGYSLGFYRRVYIEYLL